MQGGTLIQAARISAFIGLLLSLAPASAEPPVELPSAKFRVVISPEGGVESWVSEAFEKQIYQDLARQSRLIPIEHLDPPANESCGDIPSMDCILEIHHAQGIQIYLEGEVNPSRLSYEVFNTETQRSVATGGVSIRSTAALRRLQLDVSRVTKPFLEQGGLIEQSHQDTTSAHTRLIQTLTVENKLSRRAESGKEEYRDVAIKVLSALFLVPMLAVFLSRTGQKRIKRSRARLGWIWLAILVLVGTFALLNETQPESIIRRMILNEPPPEAMALRVEPYLSLVSQRYSWVIFMLGGMIWGWLLVVNLRFVISPVPGLETIGSRLLRGLLQSWVIKIALRSTLLLALYSVFLLSAWFAATAYDVRPDYLWLAVLPLCALLAIFTMATVLENIAFYLDSACVEGEATTENPWHGRLVSYLEGVHGPLSEFTLSNILFLPGRSPGVIVYGGAGSSIRVVINHRLLELGLGGRVVNNNRLFDSVEYDFLLGALHQALGRIHQGHHLSDTFRQWVDCLRGVGFDVQRRPFITAHRFLMRPLKDRLNHTTIMSDAFAALNAGLHQLVQFLYLDLTGEFRRLTTRGHSTDLNSTSQEIFLEAEGWQDPDTRGQILISRIAWLSQYTHFPMAMSNKLSPLFVLTLTAISIGLLSLSTYIVSNSIGYHSTYVSRIEEQTLALEEKIIELGERGNDND